MTTPSTSDWRPISEVPDDRKDGRRLLLWEEDQAVVGRWDPDRKDWEDPESMHLYEEITFWADILTPCQQPSQQSTKRRRNNRM